MDIFKEAAKRQLRFETPKGNLSLEQLWHLSKSDLAKTIKLVSEEINEQSGDDELSFLEEKNSVSEVTQLRFDVLKAVYLDIKEVEERRRKRAEKKAHNQEIYNLIQQKEKEGLKEKSVDELKEMLID